MAVLERRSRGSEGVALTSGEAGKLVQKIIETKMP